MLERSAFSVVWPNENTFQVGVNHDTYLYSLYKSCCSINVSLAVVAASSHMPSVDLLTFKRTLRVIFAGV